MSNLVALNAEDTLTLLTQASASLKMTPVTTEEFNAAFVKFGENIHAPAVTQAPAEPIQAVAITLPLLVSFAAVHQSANAAAELAGQQLTLPQIIGLSYSTAVTIGYLKMKTAYAAALAAATTSADKAVVEGQMETGVKAILAAYESVGLKGRTQASLDADAATLNSDHTVFNTLTTMFNNVTQEGPATGPQPVASFLTQTGVAPLSTTGMNVTSLPAWPAGVACTPLKGAWTWHFSKTFPIQIKTWGLCNGPHWWQWYSCWWIVTLGNATFSASLNVGYTITCSPCTAAVSGATAASACFNSVCASCTAALNAVATIAKTTSGSQCNYGLGLTAALNCQLAGITLLNYNYPFAWSITGPCLPGC